MKTNSQDFNLFFAELLNDLHEGAKEKIEFRKKNTKTYIMQGKNPNEYKIGRSLDPERRLKQLKIANPSLKLLYICSSNVEHELHIKCKSYQHSPEWFTLSDEQLQEIIQDYNFKKYNNENL